MQELLKIEVNEKQEQIISGRELHEFLGIETQYTKWVNRMCEYGFSENEDYITISQKRLTAQGNETTYFDHKMKIDMAKEICMLSRNEKGKQARQYFIEVEKKFKSQQFPAMTQTEIIAAAIVRKQGGAKNLYGKLRSETYKLLNARLGVNVHTRYGHKLSENPDIRILDIILADKKLTEGYIAILKEYSIKYNVAA